MPTKYNPLATLLLAGALALAVPAGAQTTTGGTATTTGTGTGTGTTTTGNTTGASNALSRLIAEFARWAGSVANSTALVTGLRDGTPVTLTPASKTGTGTGTGTSTSTTFAPATGKLGVGEVRIALSLAKAELAKQGIRNPTPAQLAAALNGGTVTTKKGSVTMPGVLAQRNAGTGWARIARDQGIRLGSLMGRSKKEGLGHSDDDSSGHKSVAQTAHHKHSEGANDRGGGGSGGSKHSGDGGGHDGGHHAGGEK
jgi:hypothetical protein